MSTSYLKGSERLLINWGKIRQKINSKEGQESPSHAGFFFFFGNGAVLLQGWFLLSFPQSDFFSFANVHGEIACVLPLYLMHWKQVSKLVAIESNRSQPGAKKRRAWCWQLFCGGACVNYCGFLCLHSSWTRFIKRSDEILQSRAGFCCPAARNTFRIRKFIVVSSKRKHEALAKQGAIILQKVAT